MLRAIQAHSDKHASTTPDTLSEFPDGTYVLMSYPDGPSGTGQAKSKLLPRLQGPFQVVRHQATDYWLRNTVTHYERKRPVHISRLKEFKFDPTRTSPMMVARFDTQEFVVQEVLKHRSDNNTMAKNSLSFLVRWAGYGSEFDTWEPWRNLAAVKALHRYLNKHGLDHMIHDQYRRSNYDMDSDDD